jgi:hypothetical protein
MFSLCRYSNSRRQSDKSVNSYERNSNRDQHATCANSARCDFGFGFHVHTRSIGVDRVSNFSFVSILTVEGSGKVHA